MEDSLSSSMIQSQRNEVVSVLTNILHTIRIYRSIPPLYTHTHTNTLIPFLPLKEEYMCICICAYTYVCVYVHACVSVQHSCFYIFASSFLWENLTPSPH